MLPLVGNGTSVATGFEVSVSAAGRTDILQSYNISTCSFKLNMNSFQSHSGSCSDDEWLCEFLTESQLVILTMYCSPAAGM